MAGGFDDATIDAYSAFLQAVWQLEDLTDELGTYDLTNSNGVTFIAGKHNDCANFVRASSQALEYASSIVDVSGDWTINIWVNPDVTGVTQYYISQFNTANNRYAPAIWRGGGNRPLLYLSNTGGTLFSVDSGTILSTATWHMLTARVIGTTLELFINAVSKGTDTISGTIETGSNFRLGCSGVSGGNSNFLDGQEDAVTYWNAGLSNAAITNLWNGGTGRFYQEIAAESVLERTAAGLLQRTAAAVLERTPL